MCNLAFIGIKHSLPPARTSLDMLLWLYPGAALATWQSGPSRMTIDLLRVPEGMRRRGLGTMIYEAWERRLPAGTVVDLFAVCAESRGFWKSLGFADTDDGTMEKKADGSEQPVGGPAIKEACR